mmetsp:Transcript_3644/g.9797  ORF Transcript_3644/g.9797 Transcript_3644/m.9797 type:complete len:208 (-) Transcript_3644:19-642(-)
MPQPAPHSASPLLERPRQPVQSLVEALALCGAGGMDEPRPVANLAQPEPVHDLLDLHRVRQVLLVGEHEERGIPHVLLPQDLLKLLVGVPDAIRVAAVHDEDEAARALAVVVPERPEPVLAADVPHRELDVPVLHGLHVEANGRHGADHLGELESVEDRALPGGVEAEHEEAHLLLANHALPDLREDDAHVSSWRLRASGGATLSGL